MKSYIKLIPGVPRLARALRRTPRERVLRLLPKGSVGAEIGVHIGDYSEQILRIVRPARLHLIDPWEHRGGDTFDDAWYGGGASEGQLTMDARFRSVEARFAKPIEAGDVVVHRGKSGPVSEEFVDGYFDWVYIDGNHLFDGVMLDLEAYYPRVRHGGYLAGDDYGVRGWWDDGVRKAVDEFVGERPGISLEVIGSQFVIRKE